MNAQAKTHIDQILATYLDMLEDAQADVNNGYETQNVVEYMKAIERHKLLSEGVGHGIAALELIVSVGECLKAEK